MTSYYLPTVLISSVGFDNKMARLLAACNSVSYLLFSLIGIPNVERWGRRKMLMYAALGQGLCYMLITILLRFNEMPGYPHQKEVASASVAFFFLYYVFFGIGFQGKFEICVRWHIGMTTWTNHSFCTTGVPWLYPAEINGLAMRNKGAALDKSPTYSYSNPKNTTKLTYHLPFTHRNQLALQFHRRRNHAYGHRNPRLALLHHLDRLQPLLRTTRLLPLPRNRRSNSRGH